MGSRGHRPGPEPDRLLVVRLGAVGDVVRTLPAVAMLRRRYPQARIGWVVEELSLPLLEGHRDIDEAIVFPRRALRSLWPARPVRLVAGVRSFRLRLREFGADWSLDFQSSFKSGVIARLSGAKQRFGFSAAFSREMSHMFANRRIELPRPQINRVERAATLARAVGGTGEIPPAELDLRPAELSKGRALLAALLADAPAVGLAPFSSRRQAWKRYPAERWIEIARGLRSRGCGVVVLGGPGETRDAERLAESAGEGVRISTDLDLRGLAALIAGLDLFIGGDTGPMHLAWAVGCPVIAVYGPTDPVINAPWTASRRILAPERPTGRAEEDRFPGIGAESVLDAAEQLLEENRTREKTK